MSDIHLNISSNCLAAWCREAIGPAAVDRADADEYKEKSPTFQLGVPALTLKQRSNPSAGARRR
jgi:hypothetical protein